LNYLSLRWQGNLCNIMKESTVHFVSIFFIFT
jgi:hypothetical protein